MSGGRSPGPLESQDPRDARGGGGAGSPGAGERESFCAPSAPPPPDNSAARGLHPQMGEGTSEHNGPELCQVRGAGRVRAGPRGPERLRSRPSVPDRARVLPRSGAQGRGGPQALKRIPDKSRPGRQTVRATHRDYEVLAGRSPHSPSVSARTAQHGDLAQGAEQRMDRGRSLGCRGGALRFRGRDRRRGFRENRARGRDLAVAD